MSKAADQAYSFIRSAILNGQLSPGSPLREESLAEASGVSRTPVREALRRLEVEQLVQRTDSKRCYVADWSLDDIEEGFVLRSMLEAHAVSRAAKRISAEQIAHLRDLNGRILESIDNKDTSSSAFADLNRQFHATIVEAAHSERLGRLLAGLVSPPVVLRTAVTYDRAQRELSIREHDELIRALEKGDGHWAQAIMVSHIRRAFHSYYDAFQAYLKANGRSAEQ
jgi:DNA-binding GntR family transcriptional regulator